MSTAKKKKLKLFLKNLNNTITALNMWLTDAKKKSIDTIGAHVEFDLLNSAIESKTSYPQVDYPQVIAADLNKILNGEEILFSSEELYELYFTLVVEAIKKDKIYSFNDVDIALRKEKKKVIYYYFGVKNIILAGNKDIILNSDIKFTNLKNINCHFKSNKDMRLKYLRENEVLLEIKVHGGFNKFSQLRAEKKAESVKNLLNYLAGIYFEYIYLQRSYIPRSIYSPYKNVTVTRRDNDFGFRSIKENNILFSKNKLIITSSLLRRYNILFDDDLSSKEKQIKLALFWIDKALHDREENEGFLELIIALEALTEQKGNPYITPSIVYQISLVCATIIGENLEERRSIIKEVKKYYQYRSKIVHGESIKDVTTCLDRAYKLVSHIIEQYLFSDEYRQIKDISTIWDHVQDKLLK